MTPSELRSSATLGPLHMSTGEASTTRHNAIGRFEVDVRVTMAGISQRLDGRPDGHLSRLVSRGGRGFRRRLLLEAARVNPGAHMGRAVRLAASVELLHLASLIHDDYVDGADFRRGLATPRGRLGCERTLLLGTAVAAEAAHLATEVGGQCPRLFADATCALADGQFSDVMRPLGANSTVEHYLDICRKKTGALMGLVLTFGVALGRAVTPGDVDALRSIGNALGAAFQIADDLDDLDGTAEGKPSGLDTANGLSPQALITRDGRAASAGILRSAAGVQLRQASSMWVQFFDSPPDRNGPFAELATRLDHAW